MSAIEYKNISEVIKDRIRVVMITMVGSLINNNYTDLKKIYSVFKLGNSYDENVNIKKIEIDEDQNIIKINMILRDRNDESIDCTINQNLYINFNGTTINNVKKLSNILFNEISKLYISKFQMIVYLNGKIICRLGSIINLTELFQNFKIDKNSTIMGIKYKNNIRGNVIEKNKKKSKNGFSNCCNLYIRYTNEIGDVYILKPKIFCSGDIQIPGCRFLSDGNNVGNIILDELCKQDILIKDNFYWKIKEKCSMFTTQVSYNFNYINCIKLINIIKEKYNCEVNYNPIKYFAVRIYYQFPDDIKYNRKCTIMLYTTGKCSINGLNSLSKVRKVYNWFTEIIYNHQKELDLYIKT